MFRIDKCRNTTIFLCLGNRMDRKRCLTGLFRSIDFDHTAFRITAYT